ncbi:hypothetical protein D7I47_11860 [Protaetiibacter intestinalis]|uniref:DUF4352 domain-containing protein n=1 Tax=Protaetiibacter intestinalis TaxID=2419774 RepID=A0A387BK27_9MICO|nr:hypothetical protein D7I47_11860 [Protaetiibacter intestinalis]
MTAALVLLALAFVVARTEPESEVRFAPFVQTVAIGERATGRNIAAQVDGAEFADTVSMGSWTGETRGVWLVVEAQTAAMLTSSLPGAELHVGERTWIPSQRADYSSLQKTTLAPGLPMAGVFVFELPSDIASVPGADRAVLWIMSGSDARLDSVVQATIDLGTLGRSDRLDLAPAERATW